MTIIPINVDRNVTKRDFEKSWLRGELKVTSVFPTFQGEGPYAGRPALFVRLAGCNIGAKLDCPWCDTYFAIDDAMAVNVNGLREYINGQDRPTDLVVVTGGEPLLQWDALVPMIKELNRERPSLRTLVWQFETNGLLLREDMLDVWLHENMHMVISPKIPHNAAGYRQIPRWWTHKGASLSLKYVVSADPDSPYHYVPLDARLAAEECRTPVYVSGMAVYKRAPAKGELPNIWDDTLIDREATAKNYAHAAKLAIQHGLRVSYQTHLFGGVE
jgi:organic radical activating enzyme